MPSENVSTTEAQGGRTHVSSKAIHSEDERRWLYPESTHGQFWTWRAVVGWGLIALFTALPLVEIGGEPAILLDILSRRFVIFGSVFHATDTIYLMLFLLSALAAVGLLTALLGRVWCGWGCPQTVYLEFVFRPIERFVEGGSTERKRLDEGPWTPEKVGKKILKHGLFFVVALGLAHTFLAYFVGWDRLSHWVTSSPGEQWGAFLAVAGTTGLILFDFAYFREQMCVTVCPYAKLQSVLLDRDSMIVSYDPNRGEPRGRRTREQRAKEQEGVEIELGDCIDCGACVRTCPTGIDIRDGLQLECVGCTQCMDACDDIMEKIGKPRGLIRYTSERALEEGEESKILRPRVVAYALLMMLAVGSLGFLLAASEPFSVEAQRPGTAAFREIDEGRIANHVQFRVRNNTAFEKTFEIAPVHPESVEMKWIGREQFSVGSGALGRTSAWVVLPVEAFDAGRAEARFEVGADGVRSREVTMELLGPKRRSDGPGSSGDDDGSS